MNWITNNYPLIIGIFGWPIVTAIFVLSRKIIFKKWEQPLIMFHGPVEKDSTFGRTVFLSVENVRLTKIKKLVCPRRTLNECHVRANFTLNGQIIADYTWWMDPELNPNGITLLPNSRRHSFDLVTKRNGDAECNIGTVAIEPDERLPQNSDVIVELVLCDGNNRMAS